MIATIGWSEYLLLRGLGQFKKKIIQSVNDTEDHPILNRIIYLNDQINNSDNVNLCTGTSSFEQTKQK